MAVKLNAALPTATASVATRTLSQSYTAVTRSSANRKCLPLQSRCPSTGGSLARRGRLHARRERVDPLRSAAVPARSRARIMGFQRPQAIGRVGVPAPPQRATGRPQAREISEVLGERLRHEPAAPRLMRVSRFAIDHERLHRGEPIVDRNRTAQRLGAGEPDAMVVGLDVEDGRQRLGVLARADGASPPPDCRRTRERRRHHPPPSTGTAASPNHEPATDRHTPSTASSTAIPGGMLHQPRASGDCSGSAWTITGRSPGGLANRRRSSDR